MLDGAKLCHGYVLDENSSKSKEGLFATDLCWKLDTFSYLKEDDISYNPHKILKFAQVVHGMTAQLEEEIDLIEGQFVVITEFIDKDWYR